MTKVIMAFDGYCFPICPRCNRSFDREYTAYCDRCGQCLSWHLFPWAEVTYPEEFKFEE